jgi:hypothetical protein
MAISRTARNCTWIGYCSLTRTSRNQRGRGDVCFNAMFAKDYAKNAKRIVSFADKLCVLCVKKIFRLALLHTSQLLAMKGMGTGLIRT